jgi:hypothetical protein
VQRVAPGTPLVIDMHRFYQATNESKLEVARVEGADASFDPTKFELTVIAHSRGIIRCANHRHGRETKTP